MHTFDREFLVKVPCEGNARVPASNTFLVEGNPWHNPNLPPSPGFDLGRPEDAGLGPARSGRHMAMAPLPARR